MRRTAQENVIAGLLVAVFAAYLLLTLDLGPNARLVPVPIALLGLGFLLVQIVVQNRPGSAEFQLDMLSSLTGGVASETQDKPKSGQAPATFPRELRAVGFLAAFVGLILVLGPVVAAFLFTTGYFVATRHFSPVKAVTVASLCTLVLYLLFAVGLRLQMYHGILAPLFEPR